MAEDLKDWRYDKKADHDRVTGILYPGDAETKYSKSNQPMNKVYTSVYPRELAIVNNLPNEEEASRFILKALDLDENNRSIHPTMDSPTELRTWLIPEERHDAYRFMWRSMIWLGCVGNTAMWLYL